jgi:hypothetical protein
MLNYVIVSNVSGILFGMMDGFIHANPVAIKLLDVYKPIAKTSVNFVAVIIVDLAYGFILAALFFLIYPGLPGENGLIKGASFALMTWFLRVIMNLASQWIMFNVPIRVLLYLGLAGLGEMLILDLLYGAVLHP